jgi:ribosomal protein S1
MTRTPWAFSPGNLIDAKYIDSRYRRLGVQGRVVQVVDEQVYIAAGQKSEIVVGMQRFYEVHVVRESSAGVAARKEAWEVLKATARKLSKVSDWDQQEFIRGMRTLMEYFPELKQVQE